MGVVIQVGEEVREISRVIPPADPAPHKFFNNWFAHLEAMLVALREISNDKVLVYCCGSGQMLNGLEARCYTKDDLPTAPLFAEVGRLLRLFPRVILQYMEHPAPRRRAVELARQALGS